MEDLVEVVVDEEEVVVGGVDVVEVEESRKIRRFVVLRRCGIIIK